MSSNSRTYLFVGGTMDGQLAEVDIDTDTVQVPVLVGNGDGKSFDTDALLAMDYEEYRKCGYELDEPKDHMVVLFVHTEHFGIKRKVFTKLLQAALWKMLIATSTKMQT